MDMKCFYPYGCDVGVVDIADEANNDTTPLFVPTDVRVFEKDYCNIDYAEGYILAGEKSGEKGKVLHFVSNGIGDYKEKIAKIQNRLGDTDVAYFVVPEIASVIIVSKYQYVTLFSGIKATQLLQNTAQIIVEKTIENRTIDVVEKIKSNVNVEIGFYATDKNKKITLDEINLGNIAGVDVKEYKVPDELKCGDYKVIIETK